MIDIQFIRDNPELVVEKSKQKGYEVKIQELLKYDESRRNLIREVETLRSQRNDLTQGISGPPSSEISDKARKLRDEISEVEETLKSTQAGFDEILRSIPNLTPDDTPLGGEENNRQEKIWGDISEKDFEVKDHQTWATQRGYLDFERGAKVAGNKFYFTKGSLVNLEFAILQAGLQLAEQEGFEPMLVPHLVNASIIDGAGFSAKSEDEKQIYKIEGEDLNLIATAEIPMTGYHSSETFEDNELPKLYAGYSPAYRMEAGAYGKHSKGLYRVHQFNKLELYVFCKPGDSESWHQKLLAIEEKFCQAIEIPYRVVRIAAGDLGAPAYKKYDIEYWSPVDKSYRELMSVSNVTDYQSRRLNIRFKDGTGNTAFVHTLNGTAAAMSRMIIALIENHQQADGSVSIPEFLRAFLQNKDKI